MQTALKLNGYTLQVGSFEHAISPDDATCVIPDGGKIVWSKVGLSIIVR